MTILRCSAQRSTGLWWVWCLLVKLGRARASAADQYQPKASLQTWSGRPVLNQETMLALVLVLVSQYSPIHQRKTGLSSKNSYLDNKGLKVVWCLGSGSRMMMKILENICIFCDHPPLPLTLASSSPARRWASRQSSLVRETQRSHFWQQT